MGTSVLGSSFHLPELNAGLWCALLEAVEQETKHSYPAHYEEILQHEGPRHAEPFTEARSYGSWPGSEDEEEGDTLAILARLKATKRKREHTARVNVPGGPCMHCGATESPQWRRPIDKDQTLCNACGIFWGRHKSLPRHKSKPPVVAMPSNTPAQLPPLPPPPTSLPRHSSSAQEILLKPLRAVRTRSPLALKGRSPTSSESHNEAHAGQEEDPAPSTTTTNNLPKRTRTSLALAAPATPAIVSDDLAGARAAPLLAPTGPLRRGEPLPTPSSPTDSSLSSQGHHNTFGGLHALAAATLDVVMKVEGDQDQPHQQHQRPTSRAQRLLLRQRSASAGLSTALGLRESSPPHHELNSHLPEAGLVPTATAQAPLLLPVMRCQRNVHYRLSPGALLHPVGMPAMAVLTMIVPASAAPGAAADPEEMQDVAAPTLVTPTMSMEPAVHPVVAEDETHAATAPASPQAPMPASPSAGTAVTMAALSLGAGPSGAAAPQLTSQEGMIMLRTLTSRGPRTRLRTTP